MQKLTSDNEFLVLARIFKCCAGGRGGGRENVSYSAAGSQRTCKNFENQSKTIVTFLWPKRTLNRDFALAGEIIHDN